MLVAIAAFGALLFVSLYAGQVERKLDRCETRPACECYEQSDAD